MLSAEMISLGQLWAVSFFTVHFRGFLLHLCSKDAVLSTMEEIGKNLFCSQRAENLVGKISFAPSNMSSESPCLLDLGIQATYHLLLKSNTQELSLYSFLTCTSFHQQII